MSSTDRAHCGWRLAHHVLVGPTDQEKARQDLLANARACAVLIALHHASRSVTRREPSRMQSAVRFLRQLLDDDLSRASDAEH